MSERLLLDEHYSGDIAETLRGDGHDVIAVVAIAGLRGASDHDMFQAAAGTGRRIVTENIKDFRPLLLAALDMGAPAASLLLVSPRRFPRGGASRSGAIIGALGRWLSVSSGVSRSVEEWLV